MLERSARKVGATGAALSVLVFLGAIAPSTAAPVDTAPLRIPVDVVVDTDFFAEEGEFETSIPRCETGTIANRDGGSHYTPWGGAFLGVKQFTCDRSAGGVDIHMNARFGAFGSTGTWKVINAWGLLAHVKASGSLVGVNTGVGIQDRYTGSAGWRD